MKGIRSIAQNGIYMQGNFDFNHYDTTIQDSTFEFTGAECGPNCKLRMFSLKRMPYARHVENIKDLPLKSENFRWKDISEDWKGLLMLSTAQDLCSKIEI